MRHEGCMTSAFDYEWSGRGSSRGRLPLCFKAAIGIRCRAGGIEQRLNGLRFRNAFGPVGVEPAKREVVSRNRNIGALTAQRADFLRVPKDAVRDGGIIADARGVLVCVHYAYEVRY